MIIIVRAPEPSVPAQIRARELPGLRAIVARGDTPKSSDIQGYGHADVRRALWEMQHKKCCYCEREIELTREDVEHRRPKAEADRAPGSTLDHGYWWLAFTWENLFYACPQCNQAPNKGVRFPLDTGSVVLVAEQAPPGGEIALLIDPERENGIDHIVFVRSKRGNRWVWAPTPRGNSEKGDWTIRICGLDREALVDRYTDHVTRYVMRDVEAVRAAMRTGDAERVYEAVERARRRLLRPRQCFVGLSYDALRSLVPDEELAPYRLTWRAG